MSWKCPDCDNEIENLCYEVSTSGYEYGTADLSDTKKIATCDIVTDTNYDDSGDTEWSGDVEYQCPECNDDIRPSNLIWINEDEDEEEEEIEQEEEEKHKIISPINRIICDEQPKDTSYNTLICKACSHIINLYTDSYNNGSDEVVQCPTCGESNTTKEFRELLLTDFFNKKLKENDNKKPKPRSIKSVGKSKFKVYSKIFGLGGTSKKIPSKKNKRNS